MMTVPKDLIGTVIVTFILYCSPLFPSSGFTSIPCPQVMYSCTGGSTCIYLFVWYGVGMLHLWGPFFKWHLLWEAGHVCISLLEAISVYKRILRYGSF